MRSASYSSSTYSSPSYSSYKSSGYSKIPTPTHRSTAPFFSSTSSASPKSTSSKFDLNTSFSDHFSNTSSKDYQSSNSKSIYSAGSSSGRHAYQKRAFSFDSETPLPSNSFDRYSPPSTSRFGQPANRTDCNRSLSLQRQTSFNQESETPNESSRFTSTPRWSKKDKNTLSRSKSVEPGFARRQQDSTLRSPSPLALNANNGDKRSNNFQYSYSGNANQNPTSSYRSSFSFSSDSSPYSYDSTPPRKDYQPKEKSAVEMIDQQAFLQRLSRAHSIVDELLNSRGLKYEEEPRFYRKWEPVEIIQEEIILSPSRRPSNASDSGLSLDNDSDRSSNFEPTTPDPSTSPAAVRHEESTQTDASFAKSLQNEYVFLVRLWSSFSQVTITVIAMAKKPPDKPPIIEKPPIVGTSPEPKVEKKVITKQAPKETKICTVDENKKKKKTSQTKLPQPETNSRKTEPKYLNQRLTLARYFRRKNLFGRSSAEISIQHVSFYQVAQSLIERHKAVEKSVRIHLRLTERAPTTSQATIIVFLKTRQIHVSSEIISAASKKCLEKTSVLPTLRKTIPAHARKQETIKPIRIPESFLKTLSPTSKKNKGEKETEQPNEIRIARGNLKRVPFNQTVSGAGLAVYMIRDEKYETPKYINPIELFKINILRYTQTNNDPKKEQLKKEIVKKEDKKTSTKIRNVKDVVKNGNGRMSTETRNVKDVARNGNGRMSTETRNDLRKSLTKKENVDQATKSIKNQKNFEGSRRRIVTPAGDKDVENLKASEITTTTPVIRESAKRQKKKKPAIVKNNDSIDFAQTNPSSLGKNAKSFDHICNVEETKVSSKTSTSKVEEQENNSKLTGNLPAQVPINAAPKLSTDEDVEEDEEEGSEKNFVIKTEGFEESRGRVSQPIEKGDDDLTEAEKAMLAARKRQENEQAAKLLDYEEHRRIEREKEEQELRLLKEKQERRRLEREREEREFAIRQQQEEERRRQEEEERRVRLEAERQKKEQEKKKRALLSQSTFGAVPGNQTGGRNFIIPTKTDRADKFGNIVQAKQEMGMTKEQQEEAKRSYLAAVARSIDTPATDITLLKEKIRILHQKICRLEADKYDLEKRQERQEYDLRELNERQRQVARNKALRKGINPADSSSSRHPPKVSIVSKYDRQFDRRNFAERRAIFENRKAYPCFPNVRPPPTIYEKAVPQLDNENASDVEDVDPNDYDYEEEDE